MKHGVNLKPFVLGTILTFCPLAAMASPGYYVQGEAGMVETTTDITPSDPYFAFDDLIGMIFLGPMPNWQTGPAGRLSGGYFWGNNNFNYGLESGITLYKINDIENDQQVGDENGTFSTRYTGINADLLGVAKYTFNCGFTVFGKAGGVYVYQYASNNYQISTDGIVNENVSVHTSGGKIYPEVAVGMGYQFTPHLETDLTLTKAFGSDYHSPYDTDPVNPPSSLFLGVTYHF
jgi:hypothetical protein